MIVSELFYTLQGEGTFIGRPSVFIRTSTCNLRCHFCDTPYTSWWNEGKKRSVEKIVNKVMDSWPNCQHIVISGGEPMLQKDLPDLVDHLRALGRIITIETNGTIFRDDVIPHLFSVSPKTTNSLPNGDEIPHGSPEGTDPVEARKIHLENNTYDQIPNFIKCGIDYQIKMVIKGREDLSEIKKFVELYGVPSERVFLMPEGVTREVQRTRSIEVAEICKEEGYTLCPRLQIELWGTMRGV